MKNYWSLDRPRDRRRLWTLNFPRISGLQWLAMRSVFIHNFRVQTFSPAYGIRYGSLAVSGIAKDTPEAGAVNDPHVEYRCHKCNVALCSQERLERHQQKVHTEAKCDRCNVTLRATKLAEHVRKVHGLAIKCSYCTRTFKSIESLNNHEAGKHPLYREWDISLKCDQCEDTFQSLEDRDQHQTEHLAHQYDWDFYTLETLERYKRDRRDLYCNYCKQYFINIVLRDQHEYITHKCSLCHSRYRNSEALQRHKDTDHSLGPLVASTSQIPMGHSSSRNSDWSVVDDSPLSSPSTVHQPDLSRDSDAELVEPRSVSGSQAFMDPELSENSQPTVAHGAQSLYPQFPSTELFFAPGIPESGHDNHFVMSGVHSGPNDIGPDEHQAMQTCVSCQRNFKSDAIHECNSFRKSQIPIHCQFCYSHFKDEESLQQHLTERISLFCDKCNLQFCYDFTLQDHIKTHPTCWTCGQSFTHESELCEVCISVQLKENVMTLYLWHIA